MTSSSATERANVLISNITVEGGFLDGLDLGFRPGLNALIGSRGVGKTSVIELIRFALGTGNLTEDASASSRQHALSVLGDGRVTVTVVSNGDRLTFSRSGSDESASLSVEALPSRPLILAQGEIERIGLDGPGRLGIIDAFLDSGLDRPSSQPNLALMRSQTAQIREIDVEIDTLNERVQELAGAKADLAAAEKEEQRTRSSLAAAESELARLDEISKLTAVEGVRRSDLERSIGAIEQWASELSALIARAPRLEAGHEASNDSDALASTRKSVRRIAAVLEQSSADIERIVGDLRHKQTMSDQTLDALNAEAVELRKRLDLLQEGAGSAARTLAQLRERVAQLDGLTELAKQRQQTATDLRGQRELLLSELDVVRQRRFEERMRIASYINDNVGPTINVEVHRSAMHGAYVAALSSALRGSGIQYATIAPLIAENLSPHELVNAVDNLDVSAVIAATNISSERAERLLRHLRSVGTADVLAAPIEDGVDIGLWDGNEHRDTPLLSTGQRCTVVLPILLLHRDRPVIIDQPEDNLDNAFVVETLVDVISRTGNSGQVICATHNPNIPVLGNASYVVEMDSDGKRGFRRVDGGLDEDVIVDAVTKVMEGGREAFMRRAEFYGVV